MILNKERTMSVEVSINNIMAADDIVRDTYSPYGLVTYRVSTCIRIIKIRIVLVKCLTFLI
jgi:hypothetical protein